MVSTGQHSLYAFTINRVKDSGYYYNPSRLSVLIELFMANYKDSIQAKECFESLLICLLMTLEVLHSVDQ